jgi:hypothetical protein
MRKRRALLYYDVPERQNELKPLFDDRGYETFLFRSPVVCPFYGEDGTDDPIACSRLCCDVMVIATDLAGMAGIELIGKQLSHQCPLPAGNRALLLQSPLSTDERQVVKNLHSRSFTLPVDKTRFGTWLGECEARVPIERPLAAKRKVARRECCMVMRYRPSSGSTDIAALVVNISACGACIRTFRRLEPQQQLLLMGEWVHRAEDAMVQWVHQTDKGVFVAGLTFCV